MAARLFTTPILLSSLVVYLRCAHAIDVQPVQAPALDLQNLGRIGLTGSFDALSLWQYTAQSSDAAFTVGGGQSLLQQLPNGAFTTLEQADGDINTIALFLLQDESVGGVFISGNFSSIGAIEAQGVALYDPFKSRITPLPGLEVKGQISALKAVNDTMFIGGEFQGANSTNAIKWVGTSGWTNLPFDGFNGPVNSIVTLSNGNLVFGGNFSNLTKYDLPTRLNGLFQWNPNISDDNEIYESPCPGISSSELDPGAVVMDLAIHSEMLLVAGYFNSENVRNIFAIENGTSRSLAAGGLNDGVNAMYLAGDLLYVGGNFTDTANTTSSGLSYLATYDSLNSIWQALGSGVNGPVSGLNPLELNITQDSAPETVIVVNGDFDQILGFGDNPMIQVEGLGVWVPSAMNWLQNLPIEQPALYGQLKSCASAQDNLYCVGTLSSYGLRASGAISLSFDASQNLEIGSLGLNAVPDSSNSLLTGLFFDDGSLNITILGGQFVAVGSYNSTIRDLAFINETGGRTISGVELELAFESTVRTLAVQGHILYVGGDIRGEVSQQNISGIYTYDLYENAFSTRQPPPLGNWVETIQVRPGSDEVYVGGKFQTAGSIACPGVCVFNTKTSSWTRPGNTLSGSVTYMAWTDNQTLLVGGDIAVSGVPYSLAILYVPDNEWAPFRVDQPIPGQITAMAPANYESDRTSSGSDSWVSDSANFWIAGNSANGSAFLMKWANNSWMPAITASETEITGLLQMKLTDGHAPNELLDSDEILMLTGTLNLPGSEKASAVLFNGTTFSPLVLTVEANGKIGTISQVFSEQQISYKPSPALDHKGTVVTIAVTIIAALIAIVIVGEVSEICRRLWLVKKGYRAAHS